ncbi:MAG TPA: Na+/H+ antiporter subunit E, partial [Bryobacteraceae bacterium]|nr:Na+/H+ antiporter subunit E [Bryobacteraceae bacterium]
FTAPVVPTQDIAASGRFRPWYAALFFAYFFVKLVKAGIEVAMAVIQPERVRCKRAVIAVPMVAATETTITLLADAVMLTPGTFILEMRRDPPTMYVHVLQLNSLRQARLDILDLERRVLLGFGPPGSVERVEELMAQVAAEPLV